MEITQCPFPLKVAQEDECAVTEPLKVWNFSTKFHALKITFQNIPLMHVGLKMFKQTLYYRPRFKALCK
jgi:hypothetical protein